MTAVVGLRGPARSPALLVDRLTGRVTMYRLVALVLLAIALAAVLLSVAGALAFPPVGLLAALATALLVGVGTNRLFAAIRGLRPHGDSGVITGLLGFFLFLPLLDAASLAALAAAVAIGNLSKYLLVVRGRHVANPVAVGAVAVLLTGLSGATWWVATPVLLPFVVLGGALVLHRAGAWPLALPALAVLVPGTIVRLLVTGGAPFAAVWTAIASYPWLFLAAFMLSEPLTAPPRRWQRVLVGVLVGALALVPLRIGALTMAPEVALVLGNLVAFAFGQRRRLRFTLQERRRYAGSIEDLRFAPESLLRIRPGQYVELSLPHAGQDGRGARRAFSPAGAAAGSTRIVTRLAEPASSFKRALAALEPGDGVAGTVVAGDFLPPRDPRAPVLWLASGVGVTPFLAMAEAEPGRDAVLLWRLSAGDDPAWAADALASVRVLAVSAADRSLPPGWERLGDRVDASGLLAAVPDATGRRAYAAGSPAWVAGMRRTAREAGLRRLRTDRFLGY